MSTVGKIFSLFFGLVIINLLAYQTHYSWDLTADRRYTFSKEYKELVDALNDDVDMHIYLSGDMPAMFKRLERAVREKAELSKRRNYHFTYRFTDPSAGSLQVVSDRKKKLIEKGMIPIRLTINTDNSEQLIFPYAVLKYGEREVVINLLEADKPGIPSEQTIHQSMALLEYKFASALSRLFQREKKKILWTSSHQELSPLETADLDRHLSAYYDSKRVNLDSLDSIDPENLIIVGQPKTSFSDDQKLLLDQHLMQGGSILFLIDEMGVSGQQLQTEGHTVSYNFDHDLDDLLFRYGVRIKPSFVLDVECSRIPLVVGQMGGQNQYELFPWYYDLVPPSEDVHEIVKNLDRLNLHYASPIDTIPTPRPIERTVLIHSSPNTRLQSSPAEVSFELLRNAPDPAQFSSGEKTLGVLLEGEFESLYKNRISSRQKQILLDKNTEFLQTSSPTKIVVIGDGDIAKNDYDIKTNRPLPLGFNKYENYQFSNRDFLNNVIEYLIEDHPLLQLRNRQLFMYLLDKSKVESSTTFWQFFNVFVPILCILGLWIVITLSRRKYLN